MPGYHHPRFYRLSPHGRWQAVGVDNKYLRPWCAALSLAPPLQSLQVKLCNGQIVIMRPRSDA